MKDFEQLSPLALAFIGDAVHTAFVRKKVLSGPKNKLNNYHNEAKKYCNAKSQKETLDRLLPNLMDEEREIVRRTRNCHSKHTAKNYDEETYKKATAFEALVGFLFLSENNKRLEEVLDLSIQN